MDEKKSLTINKSAITPWASRDEVRELGNRIKELLPGGQKLQPHEALALAQAALAHNLDPFNGEIWFIPKQGLMAGIKGHRRAGHNQMEREGGGNYWVEFVGPLSVDELNAYRIPARALAFKARLFDSKNITVYTDAVTKLINAGAPWEAIQSMFGNRPYTEGIGYAMPDEVDPNCPTCKGSGKTKNKWNDVVHCPCSEESKMSQVARSQKRAEADALKRRFDLPFTMAVGINGDKDEVMAGEFTVAAPEQDPAEVQAKMQFASKSVRGDQGDIDLGPGWPPIEYPANSATAKVMTDRPEMTPEPGHEPPMPEPPEPPAQSASAKSTNEPIAKRATISAAIRKSFVDWCNYWVMNDTRAAKYAAEGGGVNMYHILGRVGKFGIAEVTAENMEAVKSALQKHVEESA